MARTWILPALALLLIGCGPATDGLRPTAQPAETPGIPKAEAFQITEVDRFDEPWAMSFLPDSDLVAITERSGLLWLRDQASGERIEVTGLPQVHHAGQAGLGDFVAGPNHAEDQQVYLSWSEPGDGGAGAAVGRARLHVGGQQTELVDLEVIWRQQPKVSGNGHFSQRLAFSPDGQYLFVSSGDRQKMDPAQDPGSDLGKIIRIDLANDQAEHWTLGHRNPLGLAFDAEGNLWSSEMGPQGGDELNLIVQGANYGWPLASNGSHYGGGPIPDHQSGDGFEAPKAWWAPSISPGSLLIYDGELFPDWRNDAFLGALSGQALVRVDLSGTQASGTERWPMDARVREVEQGPDGSIWLLMDAGDGRLLQLTPPGHPR